MNKLDRPAREPLTLMDELETVLGIGACAINWPLGLGQQFRGVYDRRKKDVHLFERTVHGAYRAPEKVGGLDDDFVAKHTVPEALEQAKMELEMLDGAGHDYDRAKRSIAANSRPSSFGSASNNFGVQLLLDGFLELAPPPEARMAEDGRSHRADRRRILRLRLQNPGQHGPASSRPHELRAHRQRQVRARHAGHAHPHRQARPPRQLAEAFRPGSRDRE
jgi:peptide subunit release factor RF-3